MPHAPHISRAFTPTPQQCAALDAFATGGSIRLTAAAGSGKTSTLRLLSEVDPSRVGGYLAYNKAIAEDARGSFPRNVNCMTTHAIAIRHLTPDHRERLATKVFPNQVAGRLGISSEFDPTGAERLEDMTLLTTHDQARLALNMVDQFCRSADKQISAKHLVASKLTGPLEPQAIKNLARRLLPFARAAWKDLTDPNGKLLKLDHDHYLKMYALTEPIWNSDFILYDEAQDASEVTAAMVRANQLAGKQIIVVGDPMQAIYGWRGSVDAMDMFDVEHDLVLSKSFRFGEEIAAEAQKWLDALGSPIDIEGNENKPSYVTDFDISHRADAILCRTNAGAMEVFFKQLADGRRVALPKAKELARLVEGVEHLQRGKKPKHPDLALYRDWNQLVEVARRDNDPDLLHLVSTVDRFGVPRLKEMLVKASDEQHADVIIATAHSAKGREWNNVQLHDDFRSIRARVNGALELPAREEMMLNYVAVTRAKDTLGRGCLGGIDGFATDD